MPLEVHCPTGCSFRAPTQRAGARVRCPVCKSVIEIPTAPQSAAAGNELVTVFAKFVRAAEKNADHSGAVGLQKAAGESINKVATAAKTAIAPSIQKPPPKTPVAKPAVNSDKSLDVLPPAKGSQLRVAAVTAPVESQENAETPNQPAPQILDVPKPAQTRNRPGKSMEPAIPIPTPRPQVGDDAMAAFLRVAEQARPQRVELDPDLSFADEMPKVDDFDEIQIDAEPAALEVVQDPLVSRFFAVCVAMLGVAIVAPAFIAWTQSSPVNVNGMQLARWQVISMVLAGLHVAYGVFLYQVFDRAALWSVAVFLLVVTCLESTFAVGLWLGSAGGPIARWLQVPQLMIANATLWSFIYLCFAFILCCICGLHAYRWRPAEESAGDVG